MKKLFLFLLILPLTLSAQYAVADFIVLNKGMDSQYHKLEKVWGAWHKNSIKKGEKSGWAVWKRTATDNDNENAAHYVVFNQFSSKEQMDNYINGGGNFSINNMISVVKSNLKGMSTGTIRKIVQSEQKIKKQVRTYHLQLLDATPFTGGDLKIGDKMTFAPMIQKSDDYEQVESYIAKPYFLQQVMNGKHRWWAFTKVINRNDQAYKEISHIAWNIFIPDAEFDERVVENEFVQKVLSDKISSSREMRNAQELTLVYQSN